MFMIDKLLMRPTTLRPLQNQYYKEHFFQGRLAFDIKGNWDIKTGKT